VRTPALVSKKGERERAFYKNGYLGEVVIDPLVACVSVRNSGLSRVGEAAWALPLAI
jgi:hypothetical protein